MGDLRTKETFEKYRKFREDGFLSHGCNLCKADSIKDFEFWRIVDNKFPYDYIADVHHMLILKRHANDANLNPEEKEELFEIKSDFINQEYEFIIEATKKKKSIPEHSHFHLIVAKNLV